MTAAGMAAGGAAAAGLCWLLWQLTARTPAARPALSRLHPHGVGAAPAAGSWGRWAGQLWRPPARELALLGRSHRQYTTSLCVSAAVGAGGVVVLAASLSLAGLATPLVIPAVVALPVAALAAWAAHHDVQAKARRARHEFRRAVCSYLDLTALELAAGHGPVAALERACHQADGWVFGRLRETLLRAQLQLHQPWDDLRTLAVDIDVPELADMGDIVAVAGADGAVVHETLLARAESLRDQIRTDALARAKSVTSQLEIPAALLLMIIAVFALYPLLARLFS